MSGSKLPEELIIRENGFPQEAHKLIRQTTIVHDEPEKLGMHNVGGEWRVKVTSEEEEPGRGCIHCGTCVIECTHNLESPGIPFGVFWMEEVSVDQYGNPVELEGNEPVVIVDKILHINQSECCNCKKCVKECPRGAIQIYPERDYNSIGCEFTDHTVINDALKRSRSVAMVSSAHHGQLPSKITGDWLIDAAEILSPQRDNKHEYAGDLKNSYLGKREARLKAKSPIFDVNQSYGSNSHEAFLARMMGSIKLERPFFTGEGFVHPDFESGYKYSIVQFGSGGYGPWVNLDKFAGFNMKYGQDAKKGKGGRLQASKNDYEIALLRCVEALKTLTAPNPQHLQYSIEELPMRVETLRSVLGEGKLVGADAYGTAWNYPEIVVALARAGFDYITIKGGDGSTGAAHVVDMQNRGLNTVYLTHIADMALRREGLRNTVSVIAEGGIVDSFSAFLVLLAGADFVGMGMRQLHPLGCTLCKRCHTGQCAWGITSRRYGDRIDPEEGAEQIYKMNSSWISDMEGLAAGLGMSSINDVVGSRRFRYHGTDPLLYETFGTGEHKKQLSSIKQADTNIRLFTSRNKLYEDNKEELEEMLSKIEDNGVKKELKIDVGVDKINSYMLNVLMKKAVERGVKKFVLENVVGQRFIGTGVECEEIDIYGLSGNNSFAFARDVIINTYPTKVNKTKIRGNAQVAIANTSNPKEINIGGEVNDLFASYAVSGKFRVAKSGGVRNLLLFKAGLPEVWQEVDPGKYIDWERGEVLNELIRRYQKRSAKVEELGWDRYVESFKEELDTRIPPIGIFGLDAGKGMGDYFMEYAQGGIGILLNIYDLEHPIGYYACSGMSSGVCYIRGEVGESRLGTDVRLMKELTSADKEFLVKEIEDFVNVFGKMNVDERYNKRLKEFGNKFKSAKEKVLKEFIKIVPI